jgi:hypothetical protein
MQLWHVTFATRLSTENEDYNGMFTAETLEGSWINFDPGLVEQDGFIQFF